MTKGNPIGYANPEEMKKHGGFFVAFKQNSHYSQPVYSASRETGKVDLSIEAWNALHGLPHRSDGTAHLLTSAGVEVRILQGAGVVDDAHSMTDQMKRQGYTPGPWHVDPKAPEESFFEDVNVLRKDGLAIAVCVHNGDILPPEPEANARLIAAAPELLEATRQMVVNSAADNKEYRDCHKKAVAAIAKAEGQA
ncbi:hypothetical protein [Rhizobium rhizogenes]|uniref:hypothetical protein n=1 Tax=Rhizobium rhizogenes TaxID=359 RepID=UPI001574B2B9|nr:hypothetical protein [Rhizobium rhizogenes]NTF67726.1 hypothetical protein [Rhizobium rhizogenes]